MGLKEKGTILEIDHKVSRPLRLSQKLSKQAMVDIKINIMCDSLYYTDEKHREMINELREVIRKYI
jgi:hypothetical protein